MNLQQLNPWSWFKHEDESNTFTIPITRNDTARSAVSSSNHPLVQLQYEIDELFHELFRSDGFPSRNIRRTPHSSLSKSGFNAKVNVASDDKNYHISLEVPGLTEKDISLELNQNTLKVSGEKKEKNESEDRHYYRVEQSYGTFQRVLALPEDADQSAITATIKNGILDITLPRKAVPVTETKRIPINT